MKTKLSFKLISVAIILVAMLFNSFTVSANNGYLLGDVNKDGKVTVRDATIIQMYLVKMAQVFEHMDDVALKNADVNEDGIISIIDATIIQKYKVGMETDTRVGQVVDVEPTTQPASDGQWLPGFFD